MGTDQWVRRYGCAAACVLLAALSRLFLNPVLGNSVPFITFFPAVFVAAWYGGLGPALAATVLAALSAAYFIIEPNHALVLTRTSDIVGLGVFFTTCTGAAVLGEAQLRAQRRAAESAREARERQAQLEESEQRFRALFENNHAVMMLVDPQEGRIVDANPAACAYYGYDRGTLTSLRIWDINALSPEQVRERMAQAKAGEQKEFLFRHRLASGAIRDVEVFSGSVTVQGRLLLYSIVHDVTEREKMQAELRETQESLVRSEAKFRNIADTLQQSLLYVPPEDTYPGLRFKTFYQPARDESQVGGDFYDAFSLGERKVAFVVGDVCGKGLAAAAHVNEVKYLLRAYLREEREPAAAMMRLSRYLGNKQVFDTAETNTLLSLIVAVADAATGEVALSLAGGEHPLWLHGTERAETVPGGGLMLGIDPDFPYASTTIVLERGDLLLLFTDGLTEARLDSAFFGPEGVAQAALRAARSGGDLDRVGPAILGDAKAFAADGKLTDDACLLLLRRDAREHRATMTEGGKDHDSRISGGVATP